METITMASPLRIGTMRLKNRLVMPPMNTNYSDENGCLTPQMEAYYVRRAKGGVGLMVLEAVSVDPNSKNHGVQPMLYDEKFVPAWSNLIERIQSFGTKVSIEIAHFGSEATLAPRVSSSDRSRFSGVEVKSLSIEEIAEVQQQFVRTIANAKMAGVDAVTLHGAHGYLIAEFLSPIYNKRTDCYGGSLENRTRFLVELIQKAKQVVGDRFPIMVRYSVDEFAAGGRTVEESVEIAKILEKAGVAAIDLSAGIPNAYTFTNPPNGLGDTSCLLVDKAAQVKAAVHIPVICANTIRYPEEINRILGEGKVDLVALGRPLLADPDFPRKALAGRAEEIRPCLSCQHCFRTLDSGRSLRCAVNPETGREYMYGGITKESPQRVAVIGGGPAGCEAARVAALQGHTVALYEKEDKLGGSLNAAAIPPNKQKIGKLVDWYAHQMELLGVDVHLGACVTPELLAQFKPDRVIAAVGASYARFIAGSTGKNVITAIEALQEPSRVGRRVAIIGGGASGCETAEFFAGERVKIEFTGVDGIDGPLLYRKSETPATENDREVTVIEMMPGYAQDMDEFNKAAMHVLLPEKGVRLLTGTKVLEINEEGVRVCLPDGTEQLLLADTVILAAGLAMNTLPDGMTEVPMQWVGDCSKPGRIGDATYSAYAAVREKLD
ncbi:MAG: FAD-dependent oxidoreductase [Faecousia sp.]